jgi:O-antigen/teichoic acid export membrane protein
MGELDFVAEKSAQGSFHLFVGNIISEVINAVTFIIVARLLTPEEMGIYGLSFVLPSLFSALSNLGLNQALTRFLARFQNEEKWDDSKRIIKNGFLFQGGISCLLAALMYFSAAPLAVVVMNRPELVEIVRTMSLLVILQSVHNMSIAVVTGLERMDLRGVMMIVFSLVRLIIAPVLVIRGYGVIGVIYGHIVGVGVATLITIILIVKYLREKDGRTSETIEATLPDMLRFGFPLFISTFLNNIYFSYRGLLLAWFATNVAIGNLDIANKFLSLIGMFALPITTTIYPTFSKFRFNEHPEDMKALYNSSVRYATLLIIPATTIMAILSRPGITVLFDQRYELASGFLSLSILQYLTVGLGSLSVYAFLNSQGDTVTSFRLNTITLGLNAVLDTLFTWKWGVPGLLVALFTASMIGTFLNQYVINRKYGVSLDLLHTTRVIVLSIIGAVVTRQTLLYFAGFSDLLKISVGGIVFLVACLVLAPLFRAIVLNDIEILRRVLKRVRFVYPIIAPILVLEEKIIQRFIREHGDTY